MAAFKMGKVVLRSLFGKPATLMYPVVPREYTPITKGHMTIDIDTCIFCGLCAKKCPTHAITVDRNARTCKKGSLKMENTYTSPSTEKIVDLVQGPPKEEKPAKEAAAAE